MKTISEAAYYPGERAVDKPADLVHYFDSLCRNAGAKVLVHSPEEGDSLAIWEGIKELDRYARGLRKYYPEKTVKDILRSLAFCQGYEYSHIAHEEKINSGEIFLFRLLEQAARFCPKMDFLADFQTPDGQAGILYYPEWSPNLPLYSFILYRTGEGIQVKTVGETGDVKIEKIYRLEDEKGRTYYLCSNHSDRLFFRQYVYMVTGDDVQLVCHAEDFPACLSEDLDQPRDQRTVYDYASDAIPTSSFKIVFNPRKLCWEYCRRKGEYYHAVKELSAFRLVLDGERSHFMSVKHGE